MAHKTTIVTAIHTTTAERARFAVARIGRTALGTAAS